MIFAKSNAGKRIIAVPGATAYCPTCNAELIARCGEINVWHWAHKSITDCDTWDEHESAWHIGWKKLFPPEWIEITISKDNVKHRADILAPNGTVIELQHSNLAVKDIRERERFYQKMIWVFDIRDAVETERFYWWKRQAENFERFRWKHPKKYIAYATKKVALDLDDFFIFALNDIDLDTQCRGRGVANLKIQFVDWIKTI